MNNILMTNKFDASKLDYDFIDFTDGDEEQRILEEQEILAQNAQEYIPSSKVDYFLDKECKLPISFARISNVEEGIEWYKRNNPKLLDDIIPMLARHQFGNMPIKHTRHSKNKKKKKDNTLTITKGDIILEF